MHTMISLAATWVIAIMSSEFSVGTWGVVLKKIISVLYVLLFQLLATQSSVAFEYTIELTEAQLQEKIQAMMPFTKKTLMATVVVSDGKLDLIDASEQLNVAALIEVSAFGGFNANGNLAIQAGLLYKPEEGAFYLSNPKLVSMHIEQLAPDLQTSVQQLAQAALVNAMQRFPIYRFNEDDMKQKMAKAMLKSMVIQNEKIILTLSLF